MSPRNFEGLPLLPPGVHAISELHVLLCDPPRPVAVQTRRGYHLLPETLWSVAELVARAAQDLEVEQVPSCSIYRFLVQLLNRAVAKRGVLHELCNVQGKELLTVLLTSVKQKECQMLAIKDSTKEPFAIADDSLA